MVDPMDSAGRAADPATPPLERLEDAIGRPAPEISLPGTLGGPLSLRFRVGIGPLALFFYIHNRTPG